MHNMNTDDLYVNVSSYKIGIQSIQKYDNSQTCLVQMHV